MITYLSGAVNEGLLAEAEIRPELGILAQPGNAVHLTAARAGAWAADNGCFAKGDDFDVDAYLAYLAELVATVGVPLWATAPDVVGDYAATTRRSVPVLAQIRELGIPAAYVAQNGIEAHLDAIRWDLFDVIFLGGSTECVPCGYVRPVTESVCLDCLTVAEDTEKLCPCGGRRGMRRGCPECSRLLTEWKLGAGAREVVAEALRRGKRVHMGRVNSLRRLRYAQEIGCHTADGTFVKFGPAKNLPRMLRWLDTLRDEAAAALIPAA